MTDDDSTRVLRLLRRHGYNTTSFQVLEEGIRHWFDPDADSCVAYVDTGRAWVAAGSPISTTDDLERACEGFIRAAGRAGRRVCFFAVQDRLIERGALASTPIGVAPTWSPGEWPQKLGASRGLREQLRRARAKGVRVRQVPTAEIADPESSVRSEMESVIESWLSSRKMAPMGFLVDVQPFAFPEERRYFVAERDGGIVAFLVAVPIFARRGWLFEDLLRLETAPNGTSELLFDAAIRQVAVEGGALVTLGLAPLAGHVSPWLRLARAALRGLYDFDGLRRFKARLRPDAWENIHLAWPRDQAGALALHDALAAFTMRGVAQASFVRFGLETALGSPGFAVLLLAALLVPWTVALALSSSTWFPEPWVRWAWVLFDGVLVVTLLSLARHFRIWLARALAVAISLDALVTLAEVVTYNLPRVQSPGALLVLTIACVAPTAAAAFLWLALRRARLA